MYYNVDDVDDVVVDDDDAADDDVVDDDVDDDDDAGESDHGDDDDDDDGDDSNIYSDDDGGDDDDVVVDDDDDGDDNDDDDDEEEEDDDVEEDDVEEEDRAQDLEAHFVRACAVEMYTGISQEPFLCGNLQGKCQTLIPQQAFCASLRSRNAHGHIKRDILCGHLQGKCKTLDWTPGLNTYRKNPSMWTRCLVNVYEEHFAQCFRPRYCPGNSLFSFRMEFVECIRWRLWL